MEGFWGYALIFLVAVNLGYVLGKVMLWYEGRKAAYKLTDQDMRTYDGFEWEQDKWRRIDKDVAGKGELCTAAWFHYYDDLLLAVLLNPIHADIPNPRLFKCEAQGKKEADRGLKFGCTEMRLGEELPRPEITTTQHIAFGILCAKEVCNNADWNKWADGWLDGTDRSNEAASAAASAASATVAADAACAADAADAANAAAHAASAAVRVAAYTTKAKADRIDLKAIAKRAMKY